MRTTLAPERAADLKFTSLSNEDPTEKETRAPAVNRAVSILRLLADEGEPLAAKTVADRMGIAQSACQNILQVLELEELVQRNPRTLRYGIGVGLVSIAGRLLDSGVSLRTVEEELDAISRTYGVTALANEIEGEMATIICLAFGGSMFGPRLSIGRHVSAWAGASGRCYAAFSGADEDLLRNKFGQLKFQSSLSFSQWLSQIHRARIEGVGWDEGLFVAGYTNIAVPLLEGEQMRRTIVVVFASGQLEPPQQDELAAHLLSLGSRFST